MPTVQPIDTDAILAAAEKTGRIITVEEHGIGGLASAVGEVLLPSGIPCAFQAMHMPRQPFTHAGSQQILRAQAGLTPERIAEASEKLVRRESR
jgi:transketolase